ncbi:Six-hairpin glycosidase-like protein [Amylocarpus encephaloides]|uniref:Six-hairpin glycosidase-like protein n=1 Tax=Amylocarpus encephaloides TaxID=45428 RepID=A0A9P7YRB5_9HELO|nr:Six-hairpin glycosidase-like protein [Amylocarpus encephaloides]
MFSLLQVGLLVEVLAVIFPLVATQAQLPPGPPLPENILKNGTNFLDHVKPIQNFAGKTFLAQNIPFIDIPDKGISNVYYYRWSSLQRHLRYTVPGTGYILTEFVQPASYASAFNTIDAAAGHQIDEARWLRSNFYNDDYIQAYTRGPGNTTQYTHWILDAISRRTEVNGDKTYATGQLADMVRMFQRWDYVFDSSAGLYYFTPNFDAQEYSLPGYVAAPVGKKQLQLNGPNTYRPSHNSYMVANARAIFKVSGFTNSTTDITTTFASKAANLEAAIYKTLWDPVQKFFVDVIRTNNPRLSPVKGREAVGFYPFRFGIGLESKYFKAVKSLFDPNGFMAPYGPTTLETRNQFFAANKPADYCCYWNGQSWPFTTAHVLKSLAAVYRSRNSPIKSDQYVQYLRTYAATQQKNGEPYVAESHHPYKNSWSADSRNHSEHYGHSTNNDDVITGLLGIVPRADEVLEISPIVPRNWRYFAIENNANDTLQVTFARPRNITSVTLAIFSDKGRGGAIDVPDSIEIYGSEGLLFKSHGTQFLANDRNTFSFPQAATLFVSVNFFNKQGSFVGVCELEVWNQLTLQPYFFAVDAVLTEARVKFDPASKITTNGAVVGGLSARSRVAFSGDLPSSQVGNFTLFYSNSGSSAAPVTVSLNQVPLTTINLAPTSGSYTGYVMPISLPIGKNFITLLGGTADIKYELITLEGDDPNRGQVPAGLGTKV